jgi:hypothetical protein
MTTASRGAIRALAAAASGILSDEHVADVLTQLVNDCRDVLSATAVAILVVDGDEGLELLNASSHGAAEIEMLQVHSANGPCVDAIRTGEVTRGKGADELVARWGAVGKAMVDVGYDSVDAFPMRWHGRIIGGLNVFRAPDAGPPSDAGVVSQAFADIATLVLLHSSDIPADQVTARVHEAVMARSVVEQAKGVLAHVHGVDVTEAFRLLVELGEQDGTTLTESALRVVREQHDQR